MNRYFENAIKAQERCDRKYDCDKNLERTCTKCIHAATCRQYICPVYRAYTNRLIYIETGLQDKPIQWHFPSDEELAKERAEAEAKAKQEAKQKDWKVRAYKSIMRYLDKCSDLASQNNDDELVELLDNVTVQLAVSKNFDALLPLMKKNELIYYKAARLYWKYEQPEEVKEN